jgi:hypothetical protein
MSPTGNSQKSNEYPQFFFLPATKNISIFIYFLENINNKRMKSGVLLSGSMN